jgi:CHASE2 domain-containing sensor protein
MTPAGKHKLSKFVIGAALTVICGLFLWSTPMGDPWVSASYDYLFRFGSSPVTNQVVLVMMDNQAYEDYDQTRGQTWDRGLHAKLLQKLADDGCALVVFDAFFKKPGDPAKDEALAAAIRRQQRTVLMAKLAEISHPNLTGAQPILPAGMFLDAAGTNWGLVSVEPDLDSTVRRHWPFPAPESYPSLPWAAARLAGSRLPDEPRQQWLRYYGRHGDWTRLSYRFAMTEPTNYFRDKIVFIGNQPRTSTPDGEEDKFRVPYTRWTGEMAGGVEIMITTFLNLMNGDWLERPPGWAEAFALAAIGALLGGFLCQLRRRTACAAALGAALAASLGGILWSYCTNYWFPWLVIAGGQVPCALVCALVMPKMLRTAQTDAAGVMTFQPPRQPDDLQPKAGVARELPQTPDYELFDPPFGKGAYGKVWLARNAIGQWQALKVVYLASFGDNVGPYEREFNGIKRYKPVSDKHPGLLRVDFVSRQRDGYFYYVMELGDSVDPGWEQAPASYKPRDLASERAHAPGRRLPIRECLRIGLELTDALDFLHRQGLIHRDIKPQNIIFVNGRPKLADVGLIAEILHPDRERTLVGTPGYMPPPPESPGTPQADIYALGMVLYVLCTGRNSGFFPEISTTLVSNEESAGFFPLNSVILKACDPDCGQRYASAAEMHSALLKVRETLGTA